MGIEFIGNPYESERIDEDDFVVERDEEWLPMDVRYLHMFNLTNFCILPITILSQPD